MGKARVILHSRFLREIITQDWAVGVNNIVRCDEGIPRDATFLGIRTENTIETDTIEFLYEHESFENKEGEPLPVIQILFRQVRRKSDDDASE